MTTRAFWALLALLPLAACNTNAGGPPVFTTLPPTASSVGAQEQAYATQAAAGDLFSVQSSQLALQKARRPAVRAYAQRMIDGHTAALQKLAVIAGRKNIPLPSTLDPAQQRSLAELEQAGNFDTAYVASEIAAHRTALAAAQAEASGGADSELKGFAQASLPVLREHQAMVQRLGGRR
jgi:putative membrane protein